MSKHTPGPWEIDDIQDRDWMVDISSKSEGVATAAAYHINDDPAKPDDETMANARLIAASPDMYDCLVYLETTLSDLSEETFKMELLHIRAAIQKAEGK